MALYVFVAARVAFNSNQTGPRQVYVRALNSADAIPITPGPEDTPSSWTPDGKEIAFVHPNAESGFTSYDISLVGVDPPHKIRPLLNDPKFNEIYPEFSPDGQWLAYASDKSGQIQVYVQRYPSRGQPVLLRKRSFRRNCVSFRTGLRNSIGCLPAN